MRKLLILMLLSSAAIAQQQSVNVGGAPNDNTGDPLRSAFTKLNSNDSQLYGMFGATGILKGHGPVPNAMTSAQATDVVSLFSNCSGNNYLGADGICHGTANSLANLYPAITYGTCTWDASHDVGPCINLAISAAAAAGGGTVILPAGTYGLSTPVVVSTNGVHVQGAGVGSPMDSNTQPTYLNWIGGAATGVTAWKVSGSDTLFSVDQQGFTVSCNSDPNGSAVRGCDYAVVIDGVSYSNIDIGGAESTLANIWLTTHVGQSSHGTQRNYFKLWSNSTSSINSPVGILVDGRNASGLNVSLNTFTNVDCQFRLGDCVVFGNSDNNLILYRYAWAFGGYPGSATGNAFVAANSAYTTANGAINNRARLIRILRNGGKSTTWVQGTRNGATFLANSGNGGNAGLQTFSLTTSSPPSISLTKLNFASITDGTTGLTVDPTMTVNCAGGPQNGIGPNGVIQKTVAGGVIMIQPFAATLGSNIACTFSWNTTATTQNGTYILSYCTSAVPAHCASYTTNGYYLDASGASGGTSQGPINLTSPGSGTNGLLLFTDLSLIWTGTPNNGDYWTITIPNPSFATDFEGIDSGNHTASPTWEYGATGYSRYLNQSQDEPFSQPPWSGDIVDTLTVGTGAVGVKVLGINGTLLSGLATGLLRNTTGTGVPTSAELSGDCTTSGSNAVSCTTIQNASASTVNILGGVSSGNFTVLNGAGSGNVSINTTTGTGTINIGNTASGGIGVKSGASISLNASSGSSITNLGTGTTTGNVVIGGGSNQIRAASPLLSVGGTQFTVASGTGACATTSTLQGGTQNGNFTCTGTTGASTVTLTLGAANVAYACFGRDITTPTTVTQTGAKSTTSVTLTLTSVTANDVIQFGCNGY